GEGDRDAVDLLVDRVLHQGGLVARVGVGGVDELDVVLVGGGLGALADDVPEGVAGGLVGDEGDRHAGRGGLAGRGVAAAFLGLLAAGGAGTAGEGQGGCRRD